MSEWKDIAPCKYCGANGVLVDLQGDVNRTYVVCSKGCSGERHDAAIKRWNALNAQPPISEDI